MTSMDDLLKDVELKPIFEEEKKCRFDNEFSKGATLCKQILTNLISRNDFSSFLVVLQYLVQRKNQSRESIVQMIKYALGEIEPKLNDESKSELLQKIITLTEGKIFVEMEYSQAVRKMSDIFVKKNQLDEAAKLIQDIQIEAFASLERIYKVEYILYQMKILLAKKDFIRMLIVSNKILRDNLNDPGFELLKVEFYQLMIQYFTHEKKYIDVCKCYKVLYDFVKQINEDILNQKNVSPEIGKNYLSIKNDCQLQPLFENYVLFLAICPPELETKNMFNELKIKYKKDLDTDQNLLYVVHEKLSDDLIVINDDLLKRFSAYPIFKEDINLLHIFRKYWIQHDLLLFEKFFSNVNLKRISQMINVVEDEVESEIADMVVNNYLYAKMNRIEKTVNFRKKTDYHDIIDEMNYDMKKMLHGIENTCHLINKEYLKYGIKN